VIGGRPGWGKTAHATGLAMSLAMGGTDIAYYPMEVEPGEWQARLISMASGVPFGTVIKRHREPPDQQAWDDITDAVERLSALGIHSHRSAHLSLGEVSSSVRRLRATHGTSVVFIDYIQRMNHGKAARQDIAIGETVVGLKNLARDLGIAVVVMAQLNRGVDSRGGKDPSDWLAYTGIPRSSDIREAGQIEQEADAIWYPMHPVGEALELPGVTGKEAAIVWAKNRNGAPGIDRGIAWASATAQYVDGAMGGLIDL